MLLPKTNYFTCNTVRILQSCIRVPTIPLNFNCISLLRIWPIHFFFVWTDCAISSAPFGLLFSPVVGSQELTWNFVNNYAFGKFCYVFQSKNQDTLTFQEQFSVSFRSFESRKQTPKKNKIHIRQIATAIERNGQPTNQPQHHLLLAFLLTQLLCTNNVKLFWHKNRHA